jgi:NAD dependent epimerase/dehydratase family enzyme
MRVLISGASGLIATELKAQLRALGHEPLSLVRGVATSSDEVEWNPATGFLTPGVIETVDQKIQRRTNRISPRFDQNVGLSHKPCEQKARGIA